jgi:hypothetical protein
VLPSLKSSLETVIASWIDNYDHADDAAVPLDPAPGKGRDSYAFSGNFVDVTAYVFKTNDSITQQLPVTWFPQGELLRNLLARLLLILLDYPG